MVIWAIDSEFLLPTEEDARQAAKLKGFGTEGKVTTIQFSKCESPNEPVYEDGPKQNSWIVESADELKKFLENKRQTLKTVYGFNALCDYGSLVFWLGKQKYKRRMFGIQFIGTIKYKHCKFTLYDAQPLLKSFGLGSLARCGELLGLSKLQKPQFLGEREPVSDDEWKAFRAYARADANITARITAWLIQKQGADPRIHASAGTLAGKEFQLPKRLKYLGKKGRIVRLPPLEQTVWEATYAGHGDTYSTGYWTGVTYNDCKSLYPLAMSATECFKIQKLGAINHPDENDWADYVEPLKNDALAMTEDGYPVYGWIEGTFETHSNYWGLPVKKYGRTYYVNGTVQGIYHSCDLAAAEARVKNVVRIIYPVYDEKQNRNQQKFNDLLTKRLEGKVDDIESMRIKAILNAASGKLSQRNPVMTPQTNFPAYSQLLAYSHLIMATLLRNYPAMPLGIATDSIFGQTDWTGKKFEVSNQPYSFPVILDKKGVGNLAQFKTSMYILMDESQPIQMPDNPKYAAKGWLYKLEDYFKLYTGKVETLETRKDVRRTLKTQNKLVKTTELGYWISEKATLDKEKIHGLLRADTKRNRPTYDSYTLVGQGLAVSSTPWEKTELDDPNSGAAPVLEGSFDKRIREVQEAWNKAARGAPPPPYSIPPIREANLPTFTHATEIQEGGIP
jgi:hypothetical protein